MVEHTARDLRVRVEGLGDCGFGVGFEVFGFEMRGWAVGFRDSGSGCEV